MITLRKEIINKLCREIWDQITNCKVSTHEMVFILGKLQYSLGASLSRYTGIGPSVEDLQKRYYSGDKSIGVALMLNGLTVQSWLQDIKGISTNDSTTIK